MGSPNALGVSKLHHELHVAATAFVILHNLIASMNCIRHVKSSIIDDL